MTGISTLAELYLGSVPVGVTAEGEQIHIHLADGRTLALSLAFVSQLDQPNALSPESRLLLFPTPPQIDTVHITDSALVVGLRDGRVLSSPLRWFPRLWRATPAQRAHWQILGNDDLIHWPEVDEDIELLRLFQGGESLENEQQLQNWRIDHPATQLALHDPTEKYESK